MKEKHLIPYGQESIYPAMNSRSIVRQAVVNNAKLMRVATDANHGEAIREDSQSFLCSVLYVAITI